MRKTNDWLAVLRWNGIPEQLTLIDRDASLAHLQERTKNRDDIVYVKEQSVTIKKDA